jgi:hypothetical protein
VSDEEYLPIAGVAIELESLADGAGTVRASSAHGGI